MRVSKKEFKAFKRLAKEHGISFAVGDRFVLAFMDMLDNPQCRMVAVSVSYCAPEDKFHKRTGKFLALEKLMEGQFVQMPLGPFYRAPGTGVSKEMLLDAFNL